MPAPASNPVPVPDHHVVRFRAPSSQGRDLSCLSQHSNSPERQSQMGSETEIMRLQIEFEREQMVERDREREHDLKKLQLEIQLAQVRSLSLHATQTSSISSDEALPPKTKEFSRAVSYLGVLSGQSEYSNWAYRLRQIARNTSLFGHLDGSTPIPDPTDSNAWAQHQHEAGTICNAILNHVSDSVLPLLKHLGDYPTPKDLLDELDRWFNWKDPNQGSETFSMLATLRFNETEDFDAWMARVWELWISLVGTDLYIQEPAVCLLIMQAMPEAFQPVIRVLRNQPESSWKIAGIASAFRQYGTSLKRRGLISSDSSS